MMSQMDPMMIMIVMMCVHDAVVPDGPLPHGAHAVHLSVLGVMKATLISPPGVVQVVVGTSN